VARTLDGPGDAGKEKLKMEVWPAVLDTGCGVAEELCEADRPVYLSVGRHFPTPRRYRRPATKQGESRS
jgi:hypothetical protein